MAWGSTLMSAIGGGAQGAMQGYEMMEGLRLKEKAINSEAETAKLKAEISQMIASMNVQGRERVAGIGAESRERIATANNLAKESIARLVGDYGLKAEDMQTKRAETVQNLKNQGAITEIEAEGMMRMSLQELVNSVRRYEADKQQETAFGVTDRQGQTARDVANVNQQGALNVADRNQRGALDVANVNQGTDVMVEGMGLRPYDAITRREMSKRPVGGGGARFSFGGAPGTVASPVTPPTFGPTPSFGPSAGLRQQLSGLAVPAPSPGADQFSPTYTQQPAPRSPAPYQQPRPGLATPASPQAAPVEPDDYPREPDWTPSYQPPGAAATPTPGAPVPSTPVMSNREEVVELVNVLLERMRERDASVDPKKRAELQKDIIALEAQVRAQTGR